jgi:hypothetical protein
MGKFSFTDNYSFDDLTKDQAVRETALGYLVCTPRVARTGIQLYRGFEVGMKDKDWVKVYRPPEQVFAKDSLATFAGKAITNDHPKSPVNSKNWRQLAVGGIGEDILRDGEFIRVPMTLQDAGVISEYRAGKKELSVGYTCDLKVEKGVAPGGEEYDAVQQNIEVNHVAVVTAARGGSSLKIGDDTSEEGDDDMSELKTRTMTVDGLTVTVEDRSAEIIQRHIAKLEGQITDGKTALANATSAHETAIKTVKDELAKVTTEKAAADAKVTTLEQKVKDGEITPAKLDAMVKDRAEAIYKARSVLGDKLVTDGKSIDEIKKQVVEAKLGDKAKDWNESQVAASFESMTADIKVDPSKLHDSKPAQAFANGLNRPGSAPASSDQAYRDRNQNLSDAWKSPAMRQAEREAAGR